MNCVSGFQLPSACCCAASHCWVRSISLRIHVVDLRHVGELHQPVRRQDLVGRRIAEPRESAAGNFERQQPLIAVGDEALGLGVDLRRQLLGALHVIERQHVGIGAGRGLLEAAARHAQNAVHAFDHLAQRARIQPHENLAGVGNCRRREAHRVLTAVSRRPLNTCVLLAPVGNHFDLAHHDVGALRAAVHARRQRQLELADALGFQRELRPAHAPRIDGDGSSPATSSTRRNQSSRLRVAG